MKFVNVSLCGITFHIPNEWLFFPSDKFILAKHDAQVGLLKIALAENGRHDASEEEMLAQASSFLSRQKLTSPFDTVHHENGTSKYGAASYRIQENKRDFLARLMYLIRGENVLLAAYGCDWANKDTPAVREELRQCELMIRSAKF